MEKKIKIVLASVSPYRKALLERLNVEFVTVAPGINEERIPYEPIGVMVMRLAEAKARAVAESIKDGLIIGSDQAVACDDRILGKPLDLDHASAQLRAMSGKTLTFHTSLYVLNVQTGKVQKDIVDYDVCFRQLQDAEIKRYLEIEKPFDCAGSFKSEALGISLLESMSGSDPTALIGLPLICLGKMLRNEGVATP